MRLTETHKRDIGSTVKGIKLNSGRVCCAITKVLVARAEWIITRNDNISPAVIFSFVVGILYLNRSCCVNKYLI